MPGNHPAISTLDSSRMFESTSNTDYLRTECPKVSRIYAYGNLTLIMLASFRNVIVHAGIIVTTPIPSPTPGVR